MTAGAWGSLVAATNRFGHIWPNNIPNHGSCPILSHVFCLNKWMCNTAREIEAATQPLCQRGWTSHSATQPLWQSGWRSHSATQSLCQSGWSSHSYQSGWVAEWLVQPLWQSPAHQPEWLSGWSSHSGRAAEWLSGCGRLAGAATQPLSFRVAEWLLQPLCRSHSATLAKRLAQPLSHSEWLSGWVAGEPLECKQYYPDLIFLRSG